MVNLFNTKWGIIMDILDLFDIIVFSIIVLICLATYLTFKLFEATGQALKKPFKGIKERMIK